jgi:hypothetical protein
LNVKAASPDYVPGKPLSWEKIRRLLDLSGTVSGLPGVPGLAPAEQAAKAVDQAGNQGSFQRRRHPWWIAL